MTTDKIRVLVVDDSHVARMLLVHLLEADPQIHVIGAVADGQAAVDFVMQNKPDAVLMDIHMPRLDGFEATRQIMETQPVPIIICSAVTNPTAVATTFRLLQTGAVACIEKPVARAHPDFERLAANLLQTVKLMSEVRVVRRWPRARGAVTPVPPRVQVEPPLAAITMIGIGASTGGPPVLQAILRDLPPDFAAPILIVQHIARGFLPGLIEWLHQTTDLDILCATEGTIPRPGHVYLAPDDFHMGLGAGGRIVLTRGQPENGLRPAVAFLFRSLAEVCGRNALGVLLTGMGNDGAAELKGMKDQGAITIAQDRASSVVHGMPGVAIALGGATHVLAADKIGAALRALVNHRNHVGGG